MEKPEEVEEEAPAFMGVRGNTWLEGWMVEKAVAVVIKGEEEEKLAEVLVAAMGAVLGALLDVAGKG